MLSGPLRNITVCRSPWKRRSCFAVFVRAWIRQVSVTNVFTGNPLEFRCPPTTNALPLVCSFLLLSVNFSIVAKRTPPPPNQPFTTYLFRSLPVRTGAYSAALDGGRIRDMGCDCREIKPLKVMPCLIFRVTNERSSSLSPRQALGSNYSRQRKCAWKAEGRKRYLTQSVNSVRVFVCL